MGRAGKDRGGKRDHYCKTKIVRELRNELIQKSEIV